MGGFDCEIWDNGGGGPNTCPDTSGAKPAEDYACEIHSIAITETSRSRSPKTIDGDHRKRSIAIGGPTGAEQIPGRSRGDQRVPAGLTPQ
jgi:hypothetical protein